MNRIQGITTDAKQVFTLVLPNNETCEVSLEYKPMQIGWFCSVSYKNFFVRSLRVTNNPNILSQFSNLIPFGLGCFLKTDREPLFLEDFDQNNAALCLLTFQDLLDYEAFLASDG